MDYKQAGVNIEEGYKAVEKYREYAASTSNSAVLNGIGSFGGMFSLKQFLDAAKEMDDPVLVAGNDGVGTKLDIALRLKKHDTVGIDCVAMCVNDILCHGAKPLFFLDYIACGKLDADIAADFVKGVAAGCRETGTVLLGGETAEHPGMMDEGEYDLAGFTVGIVDRPKIIAGQNIREGDMLLGLASSGVHSNGFSLIRKVISDLNEDFGGMPIGRVLLEPTRLYVKPVLELMNLVDIRGMAHITGGGFYENVPRIFSVQTPRFLAVLNDPLGSGYDGSWRIPPVFFRITYGIKNSSGSAGPTSILAESCPTGAASAPSCSGVTCAAMQKAGEEILRSDSELKKLMFNTYNMGIGFVLALDPKDVQKAAAFLEQKGFPAWEIGRVEKSAASALPGQDAGGLRFV